MARNFKTFFCRPNFAIGLYCGVKKVERCVSTVFRNGESEFLFEARHAVDHDVVEAVRDTEIWDAVLQAARAAELSVRRQKIPA